MLTVTERGPDTLETAPVSFPRTVSGPLFIFVENDLSDVTQRNINMENLNSLRYLPLIN